MKKVLAILLSALLLCAAVPMGALSASAASVNSLSYSIEDGEVTITDCNSTASGSLNIPETIEGYPVTAIGSYAFYDCDGLTSITIPDTVITIGSYAFYDCDNLTSITIGNSVTTIGSYAFTDSRISAITIPASVTHIGYSAFNWCYSLSTVYIADLAAWCNIEFANAAANPFSQTASLYLNGNSVTDLAIPNGITHVNDYTFSGCNNIQSVHFADSVTSIGYRAFADCNSLQSVVIGNNVTSIGSNAFSGCDNFTSLSLPISVTSIGYGAVSSCYWLNDVYYAGSESDRWAMEIDEYNDRFYEATWHYNVCLHVYDNICDIDCNECGAIRNSAHTYDNCFDVECNVCGNIRESFTHTYDGVYDTDCNICGETRELSSVELNTNYTISIIRSGQVVDLLFIPTVDGTYTFTSFGSCDTLGYILDQNRYTLASDDDSGIGNNFSVSYSMTAGTHYYLRAGMYSSGTGSFTVSISVERNGLQYTLADGKATITGYRGSVPADLVIPEIIDDYPVTAIGSSAFESCDMLASVTIPDSVTAIGNNAFRYCDNLETIIIGNGVTAIGSSAFESCDMLASVTIPDSVTSIGSSAFENCDSLASVTIPDSVTSIGSSAFRYCYNLKTVHITNLAAWCNISFGNATANPLSQGTTLYLNGARVTHPVIPDGVTAIKNYAFYNCDSLWTITIPDSVTSIGNSAFYDCYYLQSVVIPDSVTSIGGSAFYDCVNLETMTIGGGVTSIGSSAFYGCSDLQAVHITDMTAWFGITFENTSANPLSYGGTLYFNGEPVTTMIIPDGISTIGNSAFYNRDDLTTVIIPDSVTSIGNYAFYDCDNLETIIIGNGVTSIGYNAFYSCNALTSIDIPDSVTSIGDYAFYDCYNLEHVTIGDGVTSIGYRTFYSCDDLTSIIIPDSVTTIDNGAFESCYRLESVILGKNVTSIGSSAFRYCDNLQSITIQSNLATIYARAFESCYWLTDIYYTGSESDRWNINVGEYNDRFYEATWHYNYCVHDYDDACDADCNLCGEMRVPPHTYDDCLDIDCNACGEVREDPIHVFDDIQDLVCNDCGATREPYAIPLNTTTTVKIKNYGEEATFRFIPEESGTYNFSFSEYYLSFTIYDSEGNYVSGLAYGYSSLNTYLDAGTQYYLCAGYRYSDSYGSFTLRITMLRDGLQYLIDDGAVIITGYRGSIPSHLVIPETIDGYPVTAIASDAFESYSFSALTLPSSVVSIGSSAFYDCYRLTDVYYTGSEADYQNMQIDHSNEELLDSNWHYNHCAHRYDNDCDEDCNLCGEVRDDAHTYLNDCDRDCNLCSKVRQASHVYDSACDAGCNLCGVRRDAQPHVYDNACDAYCNECGRERNVPSHVYDNRCDAYCNECDYYRSNTHAYDNVCDAECNLCYALRDVTGHTYSGNCDDLCDLCDSLREAPAHTYSDTCDIDCNVCSSVREVPHNYADDTDAQCDTCGAIRTIEGVTGNAPTFVVDNAKVRAGESFTVAIRTERNPGVVSFKLRVHYDTSVMELIGYEEGDFADVSFGPSWHSPFVVNWCDAIHPDNATNGTVVLLTFRVHSNVDAGEAKISLSYDSEDVYNAAWDGVYFDTVSGSIIVEEVLYGDLDGDGRINNRDVGAIQQYLNDWDVNINLAAADVNCDGRVNNRDFGLLQQYLNDWDVTLG